VDNAVAFDSTLTPGNLIFSFTLDVSQ
jgi:hypothetical protein